MTGLCTWRALVVVSMAMGPWALADDPPFDPTSPEDVAERNEEKGSGEPDLSGPEVDVEPNRPGPGLRGAPGAPDAAPDMRRRGSDVTGILSTHCERCHGALKQKGGLQILPLDQLFTGSEEYWVVRRGDPQSSELFRRITLASSHEDIMPPEGEPLSKAEVEVIETWIRSGASTDVQRSGRQNRVRPREWFELYMGLDLDQQQQAIAREQITAFQSSTRSFEREHRQRINELKQITESEPSGEVTAEDIQKAKAELNAINKMKQQVEAVQSEMWSALTPDQQDAMRTLLAAAQSNPQGRGGDRANRGGRGGMQGAEGGMQGAEGGRRGAEGGRPSTLTPEEQRKLRELMRSRRRDQGSGGDGGPGRD